MGSGSNQEIKAQPNPIDNLINTIQVAGCSFVRLQKRYGSRERLCGASIGASAFRQRRPAANNSHLLMETYLGHIPRMAAGHHIKDVSSFQSRIETSRDETSRHVQPVV